MACAERWGTVSLVGAGPGDPGLLTLRGAELLRRADVVVFDGLVNPTLLELVPVHAERIYAGKQHAEGGPKLAQTTINTILVECARAGKTVVRLKGGDPFIFGRGAEEAEACAEAGIRFEIVPGVSALSAVAAYAGISLTHRPVASTVAVAAGHEGDARPWGHVNWEALARTDTVVLFMAVRSLPECVTRLVAAGRSQSTPVAVIRWGTTPNQHTVVGTLGDIAGRVQDAGLRPPALAIIGEAVRLREKLSWYEKRPLFGARVLVPRQKDQAEGFARALTELGAEPLVVPVTRIEAADSGPLEAELAKLPSGFEWVAFASANAVEHSFAALARLGKDARAFACVRLGGVGDATREALRRHGLFADAVPVRQDGRGLAAAMAALDPELGGHRILLPRAQDGRNELKAELGALGAAVTAVAAYRTVPMSKAELAPLLGRLRRGELHVLTFFAPSQVSALCDALEDEARVVLERAGLVAAVGPTTAEALRVRGLRVDLTPPQPAALAAAIAERWRRTHAVP